MIGELVEAGIGRPPSLFDRVRVLRLDEAALLADPALARLDPELWTPRLALAGGAASVRPNIPPLPGPTSAVPDVNEPPVGARSR